MTPTNPPAKHPPPRYADCGYVGLTRDPQHKCDKCKPLMLVSEHTALLQEERARAFEEAAKEVDAWLDLLEVDHRDIIAKQQYKDPQEAGREYRNKCNLLGAVRVSILKKAHAARSPDCNNRLNQGEKEPEVKTARSPGDAEKGEK